MNTMPVEGQAKEVHDLLNLSCSYIQIEQPEGFWLAHYYLDIHISLKPGLCSASVSQQARPGLKARSRSLSWKPGHPPKQWKGGWPQPGMVLNDLMLIDQHHQNLLSILKA